MKRLLFFIFGLLIFSNVFSQDILISISGDSVLVSIQEIGLTEVKYKKYNDQYGITYGILKAEVRRIRYESGRIENFVDGKMVTDKPLLSPEEKCACG